MGIFRPKIQSTESVGSGVADARAIADASLPMPGERKMKSPISWPNGKVYMFQGTNYIRYYFRTGALGQATLPIASSNLLGLRGTTPDAAVHLGFGKVYFFYSDEYVRFDIGLNTVEPEYLQSNPPTKIAGDWAGLPNDWTTTKIDAAVNWGNGQIYFFRGSEYLRFDITFDRADPDYPKSIAGSWNGGWDADLDGVLYQGERRLTFSREMITATKIWRAIAVE